MFLLYDYNHLSFSSLGEYQPSDYDEMYETSEGKSMRRTFTSLPTSYCKVSIEE